MAAIANVKVIESMIEVPAAASAQYRKVDREAKVGDLIRFDDESSFVTRGGFYEVVEIDWSGDPQILDNDGDEYDLAGDDYEVYEKVTEAAAQESDDLFTYEGTQYRKVKRKAAVGERILIVAIASESRKLGNVSVGEVFTVKTVDSIGDVWEAAEREFPGIISEGWEGLREYVVLEPVKSAEPPKPATPPVRIPVGSYVKSLNSIDGYRKEGDILKVVLDDGGNSAPYRLYQLDGSYAGYASTSSVKLLSESEARAAIEAKEKRQQAEAERQKWAAIGREVNEYKAGDLVHYVCKNGKTAIGTVEDVEEDAIGVRNGIKTWSGERYVGVFFREGDTATLIVPVEQRFDRTEAVS